MIAGPAPRATARLRIAKRRAEPCNRARFAKTKCGDTKPSSTRKPVAPRAGPPPGVRVETTPTDSSRQREPKVDAQPRRSRQTPGPRSLIAPKREGDCFDP